MARPEVPFNWQVLDAVLECGASKIDCVEFLKCSIDTLERRIRDEFDMTFTEYKDRKMSRTRIAIKKKQIDMALKGDRTMLIWTGKQYCEQSDKFSEAIDDQSSQIQLKYSVNNNKYVNNKNVIEIQPEKPSDQ